ncbi:evC complex member EVC [Stigmatopora nigra]
MSERDSVAECSTEVLVHFTESLQVYTGLLTVATVCGGLLGILAAALLYIFCLKTLILTRQGNNARRLLEPDDGKVENKTSDHAEPALPVSINAREKQEPMNSEVAAFASKAKVVYPINQKYRPLADGASNPSLHECSKLATMPKDNSSATFSEEESLSQELDNDEGSQFISSSLVPRSLQNQSFVRVYHYPYILTQTGFEARINLHCLALTEIQQLYSQLLEEKYVVYLQMVKKIFCSHFPKNKNDANFTEKVLQMQEKEVDELKKQLQTVHDHSLDAPCTLDEMERCQKDFLERSLQMSKNFCRVLEELSQHVMKTSSFPADEAHDRTFSLNQTLVMVENQLMNIQEAQFTKIHQKLLWWEELSGLLQSQPALVQQEMSLRQVLMTTTLEQMTSEDVLTFSCMETILSEVQQALTEGLQLCREDYARKTKELLVEKYSKIEAKRKKLRQSQAKERSRMLESRQTHGDPEQLSKEYQELLSKQRRKLCDLELQQDNRMAESLTTVWTKLRSTWSKRLEEQVKGIFFSSVTAQRKLSDQKTEALWLEVEQQLSVQQQQLEKTTIFQLDQIQAQIHHERQVWNESMALVYASLKHLKNQQMKSLRAMVLSQSYTLNSQVANLLEKKHEHLLACVQRDFMARHFSLHILKEMRLSKLKVLSQTDFRALLIKDLATVQLCVDSNFKFSSSSLAEKHLGPESQLVSHGFHQEFLSELETGAEILKNHAQLVLGNALSHGILQLMESQRSESQSNSRNDDSMKNHLAEAASESVYVTKDSLAALIQSYYLSMQDIAKKLQPHQSKTDIGVTEEGSSSSELNKALLKELENWGKKPTSTKFQQRVELHKRKLLEQCDLEQERMYEDLRQRKVVQDQTLKRINAQLQEAERSFISDLAALARVFLPSPEAEASDDDDNTPAEVNVSIMELLARNPALDPALNPSLTPTFVTPAVPKLAKKKKRERESHISSN